MNYPSSFFATYLDICPSCNQNLLDSVLDISSNGKGACITCGYYLDELRNFWNIFTNSPGDIQVIARYPSSREKLRRLFLAYAYRGIHKPVILPSSMKIEITRRCNLNCKHCLANSSPDLYPELSLDEVKDLLFQAKKLGVNSIGLVGGEPFLRKDLPEIVETLADLKMYYSVSTNGMLITEKNVKKILTKYLLKVSVSIDGDSEYHNYLRQNKNAYQHAFRGIRILKSENIPVAIAMVINKNNTHLIQSVIEDAIHAKADFFMINDLIPTGRGLEIRDESLSYTEYLMVTEHMKFIRQKYGDKIKILWKGMNPDGQGDKDLGNIFTSKCGAALTELTVNNEGYILPCPFLPQTTENIRHKRLEEIWYNSEELMMYQNRELLTGGCGNCHKKYSCSGCRARALAHTGSIYGPDIRCPACQ